MKIKLLFSAVLLIAAMTSCNDQTQEKTEMSVEQAEAIKELIRDGYMPMEDQQYVLKITEAEAVKRGITLDTYKQVQVMVEEANDMIRKIVEDAQNDPSVNSIEIHDGNDKSESAVI